MSKLSFHTNENIDDFQYACDIEIKEIQSDRINLIKHPLTTNAELFIDSRGFTRVNKDRNISLIANHKKYPHSENIIIPEIHDLIYYYIALPLINGKTKHNKFSRVRLNEKSKRLTTLIDLYEGDLYNLHDLISDKYWYELFERQTKSEKATGESITFDEFIASVKAKMAKSGYLTLNDQNQISSRIDHPIEAENKLRKSFKAILNSLIESKIYITGMNLSCKKCNTKKWYHLTEINEQVLCKGCYNKFTVDSEPKIAYKLNEIVKNNLFETELKKSIDNDDEFLISVKSHGNYAILNRLSWLQQSNPESFRYLQQIDLHEGSKFTKFSDLDLFCITGGLLKIGEVKTECNSFKKSDIEKLAEIASLIRPDSILLCCESDRMGKIKQKAKALSSELNKLNLKNRIVDKIIIESFDLEYICNIETYVSSDKDYYWFKEDRFFLWFD